MKDDVYFYGDDHHFNKKWLWLILAVIVASGIAYAVLRFLPEKVNIQIGGNNDEQTEQPAEIDNEPTEEVIDLTSNKSLEVLDTMVNGIKIRLLVPPVGCMPRLRMGYDVLKDTATTMLCLAAADAGRNDKIIGNYVIDGKLISKGLSKKGFCAIIGDSVTIGMSESSPLFERAVNDSGSFFRQRALVYNDSIVINKQRGQFLCRALCLNKEGRLFVVQCLKRCSYYDFSQLLKDIGVEQAISLQSAKNAKGWYHDGNGKCILLGDWESREYPKSANYIVWSR